MEKEAGVAARRLIAHINSSISLLSKEKEIEMRRRLPARNQAEWKPVSRPDCAPNEKIGAGPDAKPLSDALLGIFDAIAPAASAGLAKLADKARVLHDPDKAASRMSSLLAMHGVV
jgi:hypothetical protein